MDNVFANRLKDLSNQALRNGKFTFTNFLSLDELSTLKSFERELGTFSLFGGADGCERVIARFGSPEDLGYEVDFPICCLMIKPKLKKFADVLSHRDFLGAIMNLGIERACIGDIIVKDSVAYVFVLDKMADFICENLTKVRHTVVLAEKSFLPEQESLFTLEDKTVIVSSLRLDCIISALYNLSRNDSSALFADKKVFVQGKICENISHQVKQNEVISVRGAGRFIIDSISGQTKKGRLCLNLKIYK
jgi:RNA-binding protein YlmH